MSKTIPNFCKPQAPMKLVLLQPPIEDFYHTPVRLVPLGLGYLKASG